MSAAPAIAVATPCCPAPVSAIRRFFSHGYCKQGLPKSIIEFMRPAVNKILTLEIDLTPAVLGHIPAERKGRLASGKLRQIRVEFSLESRVVF